MNAELLIVLLALGTVGGYSSGFASLRYRSHCRHAWTEARAAPHYAPCPGSSGPASHPRAPEAPPPSGPR